MLLVHLFVCFVRVSFCLYSLLLCVGCWLRFVIVALLRLFYNDVAHIEGRMRADRTFYCIAGNRIFPGN